MTEQVRELQAAKKRAQIREQAVLQRSELLSADLETLLDALDFSRGAASSTPDDQFGDPNQSPGTAARKAARGMIRDGRARTGLAVLDLIGQRAGRPIDRLWKAAARVQLGDPAPVISIVESLDLAKLKMGKGLPRVLLYALAREGRTEEALACFRHFENARPELTEALFAASAETAVGAAFRRIQASCPPRNEDELLVFYHLPFAGGTSLAQVFKKLFPPARTHGIARKAGLLDYHRYLERPRGERDRLQFIHLHHPIPIEHGDRPWKYFTVLRDPTSQFMSGFFKRRASAGIMPLSDDVAVDDLEGNVELFLDRRLNNTLARQLAVLHPTLRNQFDTLFTHRSAFRWIGTEEMLHYNAATAGIPDDELFDMTVEVLETKFYPPGVMQYFSASFYSILAQLGFPVVPVLPHSGASKRKTAPERLGPALEQRLVEANQVDQRLYERYRDRFLEANEDLIAALASR